MDLEWHVDPIDLALRASAVAGISGRDRTLGLPTPFCVEVGRRLLLAQLEFSRWVLRRVETVSLGEGRSVSRKTAIEFKIRQDAPAFLTHASDDGSAERLWLVPLAVMKRRTLVDFHLSNEDGSPLTLPGLRLTQQLDESMLLAAAATACQPGDEVRDFVQQVVAGNRQQVADAIQRYESGEWGEQLAVLRDNALFAMTLDRLRYNFTLYVLLSQRTGRRRHLNMSFVEPVTWRYQYPTLTEDAENCWSYRPMNPSRWNIGHLASELGLTPTRVRFQTPAAENAASYHLEVVAPPGVRIVAATLLAGRPHVSDTRVTLDPQRGDYLTVGLHGVEVPPNSLCRAQIQLRVQRAGWLTTLLIVTLAIFLVLASLAWHSFSQRSPGPEQDTNVIVLLITTAAAAAAFLSQRDFTGVAARLITGMRTVGAISMSLPIVAAGFLSYRQVSGPESVLFPRLPDPAETSTRWASAVLTVLAFGLFLLVLATWRRTRSDENRGEVTSPWDQSLQARPDPKEEEKARRLTYMQAQEAYGFALPAVGVRSSEGWHHIYRWTDVDHERAIDALCLLAGAGRAALGYRCADPADCPHVGHDGCPVRRSAAGSGDGNFARETSAPPPAN